MFGVAASHGLMLRRPLPSPVVHKLRAPRRSSARFLDLNHGTLRYVAARLARYGQVDDKITYDFWTFNGKVPALSSACVSATQGPAPR